MHFPERLEDTPLPTKFIFSVTRSPCLAQFLGPAKKCYEKMGNDPIIVRASGGIGFF